MRLAFDECGTLPKLARVAEIHRSDDTVRIVQSPWVETRDDRFFEGACDGDFNDGAFDDAVTFLGSGGRLTGNGVTFAGPTHKLERGPSRSNGECG